MRELALVLTMALGSTFAVAAGDSPSAKSANDASVSDYWNNHAQTGSMTKEAAMKFKSADGKSVDWERLDANHDGKVDHEEWTAYTKGGGGDMDAIGKAAGTTQGNAKKAAP